jgi:hypothetical protein
LRRCAILLIAVAGFLACAVPGTSASDDARPVVIYLVRHGEVDMDDPALPLDGRGLERAQALSAVLKRVPLTHVLSSHTLRSRQTVAPAAESHRLAVTLLPALGSEVDGTVIDGVSPSRLAVAPLSEALNSLPPGSVALVGANSDNLFAILNRLGVPLGTSQAPCELGGTCVPCLDNTCFPDEFDNLWILVRSGAERPPALMWIKY